MSVVAVDASAQHRHRRLTAEHDTVSVFVRSYLDSLLVSRQNLDSVYAVADTFGMDFTPDSKLYRLFVPLTFYHNVAHDRFSLDAETTPTYVDDALLSLYFRRPDLVQTTQSKMDVVGPIYNPTAEAAAPTTDMVEKVAPVADDADIDIVDIVVKRPNFWKFSGDFRLDLCQNYYSGNWYQGGESSYTMKGYTKLYAKYDNKKRLVIENTLETTLGFTSSRTDTVHSVKTNADNLRYLGKVNIRAVKNWAYSLQLDANTQMMRNFKSNTDHVNSDFCSPLNLNLSVGMTYSFGWFKNKLSGNLSLMAFSYNYKYSDRKDLAKGFGIPEGHRSKQDYGSRFDLNLNIGFIKNVTWKIETYGYTTYKRTEFQCINRIDFKFNKYLSTHFDFYSRFDDSRARDDHHGYWQFRDYMTFGLSYSI